MTVTRVNNAQPIAHIDFRDLNVGDLFEVKDCDGKYIMDGKKRKRFRCVSKPTVERQSVLPELKGLLDETFYHEVTEDVTVIDVESV